MDGVRMTRKDTKEELAMNMAMEIGMTSSATTTTRMNTMLEIAAMEIQTRVHAPMDFNLR
jgi:hypothetical protein